MDPAERIMKTLTAERWKYNTEYATVNHGRQQSSACAAKESARESNIRERVYVATHRENLRAKDRQTVPSAPRQRPLDKVAPDMMQIDS